MTKSPARSIMTSAATFGSETSTTRSPARDSPTTSPCRRCVSTMNARGSAPSATATSSGGPGKSRGRRGGRALELLGELRGHVGDAPQRGGLHLERDGGEVADERGGIVAGRRRGRVGPLRSRGYDRRRTSPAARKAPSSPMDARALDDARRALVAPPVGRAPARLRVTPSARTSPRIQRRSRRWSYPPGRTPDCYPPRCRLRSEMPADRACDIR